MSRDIDVADSQVDEIDKGLDASVVIVDFDLDLDLDGDVNVDLVEGVVDTSDHLSEHRHNALKELNPKVDPPDAYVIGSTDAKVA